jgi:putative membrane protein
MDSSPTTDTPQQMGAGARNAAGQSKVARVDRKFIEEATASSMMEIQAAQMAATRSADPAVKSYATVVADHHTVAHSELMQIAATMGVEPPSVLPRSMRNELDKLSKRGGADFDREFVREVGIKEHDRDIKRYLKASREVQEPQLRAWVDKNLPILRQHLADAQKLPQAGSEAAAGPRGAQERMGAGR